MTTTIASGPYLQTKSGKYYSAGFPLYGIPATIEGTSTTSTSTVRSWSKVTVKSDGPVPRRRKPVGLDLISNIKGGLTAYGHKNTLTERGLYGDGLGNQYINDFTAGPPAVTALVTSKAVRRSVMSVRRQIKDEVWNLSTFVAEMPQTWRYVQQVASGLLKSYRAVKQGDLRKLRNMAFPLKGGGTYRGGRGRYTKKYTLYGESLEKGSESKWMEWRYAVTPMMYDLEDSLKFLYSSSTRPIVQKVDGLGIEKDFTTYQSSGGKTIQEVSMRCKTTVYYEVLPSSAAFKRLGMLNPVATLYELMPLSFVLDWFLPLGDYLASLDAMAGASVYGSTQSISSRLRAVTEKNVSNIAPKGYTAWQTPNSWSEKSFSRSISPSLDNQPPVFEMSLSASRLIDSFVLLRYAFRKS